MKQQSITALPPSPEQDRRSRMIKYSVAMGVRIVCIVLMLVVQGWWLFVFAAGAIFLPYFAVVIANVSSNPQRAQVLRPGAVVPVWRHDGPDSGSEHDHDQERRPPRAAS
ncbi:MAG: DUF3099 domain-containing protein [Microbacteriaceae bacterium]